MTFQHPSFCLRALFIDLFSVCLKSILGDIQRDKFDPVWIQGNVG
jgi:hypothetical protein